MKEEFEWAEARLNRFARIWLQGSTCHRPFPDRLGKPSLWTVEGRWLKSHWAELERQVNEYLEADGQ